jgi:hypothetical protein
MEVNQLMKNHYHFFNTQAGGGFYLLLTKSIVAVVFHNGIQYGVSGRSEQLNYFKLNF